MNIVKKVTIRKNNDQQLTSNVTVLHDDGVRSLLKCIYVLVIMKNHKLNSELAAILRANIRPATAFLSEHRLGSKVWRLLFEAALEQKSLKALDLQKSNVWDIMRTKSAEYSSNSVLTNLDASIIRDFRTFLKSGSESAYARLEKNAKETNERAIFAQFLPDEQDASIHTRALRRIIKKHEPENNTIALTLTAAATLRDENLPEYKQYLKTRLNLKKAYNAEIMAFVRMSESKLVSVNALKKHMRSIGMPNLIQDGFVGQIDESGNYYTRPGKTCLGRRLKTTPGGPCSMNLAYDTDSDNTYVFKSQTPGAKNETMFYTIDFGASSQADKYAKVLDNMPRFGKARTKWIKDIMSGSGEKFLYAMLCEVSYLSTARIGSRDINISAKGKYEGKHTFGIRTLQCKHVKIEAERIVISYLGVKTSAKLKHYIYKDTPQSRRIYDHIVKRVSKANPTDALFVNLGKMASPTKLNAYVKSLGLTITIHKFRTIRGTEYFVANVAKSKLLSGKAGKVDKVKGAKISAEITKTLEAVGKELGHFSTTPTGTKVTGTTALQYYIIPHTVLDLYNRFMLRMPPNIKKLYDEAVRGNNDD